MIRQNQRFLTQLYVITDAACMLLVFFTAYWIKFDSGLLLSDQTLPFLHYYLWGTVYSFIAIMVGFYTGFYTPRRKKSFTADVLKIVQVQSISFLVLLSMLYVGKEVHISREMLIIFFILNAIVLITYRYVLKRMLFRYRSKGYNKKFVLILGAGSVGRNFDQNLHSRPELGYEVLGFLDDKLKEHGSGYRQMKPIIGTIDELGQILNGQHVDEVIIALPLEAHDRYAQLIEICDKAGVKALIIPDFFDLLPARPYFDNFAGIPIINARDIPLDEISNRMIKRAFDIVFSIVAIILSLPVLFLIAIGVKLTSHGPIFFHQERMGMDRRTFRMYKYRTMKVSDAITSDTQWTIENDSRRTRFGSFLRKTSLDELPQFFNVLKGDMSVVGPRPERPYFVEQFKEEIPKYMVKHHIRPGITGWAQSNGLRGDTSIKDRIVHDLFYIENWSFLFDMKIICKTIYEGLVNRNAY